MTFPVEAMPRSRAGRSSRPCTCCSRRRGCSRCPDKQRLPAILAESRQYQNLVSTKLAEQVLAALYELLRGFQAADDLRQGELLREVLRQRPQPRLRAACSPSSCGWCSSSMPRTAA